MGAMTRVVASIVARAGARGLAVVNSKRCRPVHGATPPVTWIGMTASENSRALATVNSNSTAQSCGLTECSFKYFTIASPSRRLIALKLRRRHGPHRCNMRPREGSLHHHFARPGNLMLRQIDSAEQQQVLNLADSQCFLLRRRRSGKEFDRRQGRCLPRVGRFDVGDIAKGDDRAGRRTLGPKSQLGSRARSDGERQPCKSDNKSSVSRVTHRYS